MCHWRRSTARTLRTAAEERDHTPVGCFRRCRRVLPGGDAQGAVQSAAACSASSITGEWAPRPPHFLRPASRRGMAARTRCLAAARGADAGVAPVSARATATDGSGGLGLTASTCRRAAGCVGGLPDAAAHVSMPTRWPPASARHEAGVTNVAGQPARQRAGWPGANRVVRQRAPEPVAGRGPLALCMVNGDSLAAVLRRGGEPGALVWAPRRSVIMQCLAAAVACWRAAGAPLTLFGLWLIRLQDHGYTDWRASTWPVLRAVRAVDHHRPAGRAGAGPARGAHRAVLQVKSLW